MTNLSISDGESGRMTIHGEALRVGDCYVVGEHVVPAPADTVPCNPPVEEDAPTQRGCALVPVVTLLCSFCSQWVDVPADVEPSTCPACGHEWAVVS